MTKILIIAGDVLPLPGYPTTGAGLRAWSLGQGLEAAGLEVHYSMPRYHVKTDSSGSEYELSWDPGDRERPIRAVKPDIIVSCHWPAMPGKRSHIPTVLDLHGPHLMERTYWDRNQARQGLTEKVEAFRKADFFICAGERQRYYFSNWLHIAGFPLRSDLIKVIPVSLSPDLPQRFFDLTSDQDPIIVYGGMFLPWQDPVRPLQALAAAMTELQRGQLHVFGGPHPLVTDQSLRFEHLLQELSNHERVRIMPQTAHDDLIAFYLKAHIAFDLMEPNIERELAFTTRTVEYLWCGLPVIYNNYSELSQLIDQNQAGWTLPTVADMKKEIKTIISDPAEINRRAELAQQLIRTHLSWDRTVKPLSDFCGNPQQTIPERALLEFPVQPLQEPPQPSLFAKLKRRLRRIF